MSLTSEISEIMFNKTMLDFISSMYLNALHMILVRQVIILVNTELKYGFMNAIYFLCTHLQFLKTRIQ